MNGFYSRREDGIGPTYRAGTDCKHAKLDPDKVREIRASSEPDRVLAERYRVSHVAIWKCRNRITWANVS